MFRRVCALLGAVLLSACAIDDVLVARDEPVGSVRDDFRSERVRTYHFETTDRVMRAIELVLQQSDPEAFEFYNTPGGFMGQRRLGAARPAERWVFRLEPEGDAVRVSLSVTASPEGEEAFEIATPPLYRLFWNRVDYVLGRRPEWVTCGQASAELQANNLVGLITLSGLCGLTNEGRIAPPPQQLPQPKVASAPPAKKKQKSKGPAKQASVQQQAKPAAPKRRAQPPSEKKRTVQGSPKPAPQSAREKAGQAEQPARPVEDLFLYRSGGMLPGNGSF